MPPLASFEASLAAVIGRPSTQRPFVCDGSPLECEVFLCGFNPASPSSGDFWTYWQAGFGYDKSRWFDAYKAERLARPLKLGKTRRNAVSNTRRVIDWIVSAAGPAKILETNIHSVATESMAELQGAARSTSAFDFLMAQIKPRLVVTHGVEAAGFMRSTHPETKTLAVKHLSRGWSEAEAVALGGHIATVAAGDA